MATRGLVWIALIGLNAHLWMHCDCACTFPTSLTGDFVNSLDNANMITFTSDAVIGFDFTILGTNYREAYECYANTGDTYLIKSNETRHILDDIWIYRCLEIYQTTDDIFYFYYTMPYLADAKDYMLHSQSLSVTTDVCTRSSAGKDNVPYILVKDSVIGTASTTCPNVFLGKYSYTAVKSSDNNTECTDADMNSCVNKDSPAFNKTSCATDVSYSANGDLHCGSVIEKSGVTYLYTINPEGSVDYSTTQRFLCFAMVQNGDTVVSTVKAGACAVDQTEVDNGDYKLEFTPNTYTCPIIPTETPQNTTPITDDEFPVAIVVAVVVVLLVIIIACVVGYVFIKHRKGAKVANKQDKNPDKDKPKKKKVPTATLR